MVAKVATEHWPPWEIATDKERKQVTHGVAIDILRDVFKELDISLEYKNMSWQRALLEMDNGEIDIIPVMSINGDRRRSVLFTAAFHSEPIMFAYNHQHQKDFKWNTLGDLHNYRIAAVEGRNYAPDWANLLDKNTYDILRIKNDTAGIRMLVNGRVDLIPLIHSNGIHLVQETTRSGHIRFHNKALMHTSFHFGISHKSPLAARLPEINKVIHQVLARDDIRQKLKAIYSTDLVSTNP